MSRLRLSDAVLDSDHVLREAKNQGRNEAFINKVQSLIPRISPDARGKVWDWCANAKSRISQTALPFVSLMNLLENDQYIKTQLLESFPEIAEYVEEYTPKPGAVIEIAPQSEEKIMANDSSVDSERKQTRRGALAALYSSIPPDRASA